MSVLRRVLSIRSRTLWTPLAGLMFFLPTLAAAQTVPYRTTGVVSITGGPPIYNGRFVLKQSDYGFFWLDTTSLEPGHVQVVSKCTGFQPPSDTGLYVVGDCNGISNISSSGDVVVVRQFSGNCLAATLGCPGPRDDGHFRFTFALGTFAYLGDGVEIPDSAQTTDPQGRTWTISSVNAEGRDFFWQSSGLPNSPPVAVASATNLSAASRADKANYYGDRWQLQDTSSGAPTSVTWDFNNTGPFVADETGTKAAEGTVIGYFPCDPSTAGNIRSGGNCRQSLGLANPPAAGSYQFALRSANQYGPSANTFVSAAIGFSCPQAGISGSTGFAGTCAKSGGTLSVPIGGNADAGLSSGNIGEAVFSWTFTFPSGSSVGLQGVSVPVPNGANGFLLSIVYPGGYQATAAGAVTFQPALVPDFSAPGSVIRGSTFSLVNQMQKAATTTLNSVDYLFNPGACGTPPAMPSNPLASSFLSVGGSAAVTAPNAVGGYCIFLRFNYTPGGSPPSSQTVSHPLTVTEWVPSPSIGIYLDSSKIQPAQFMGGSYYLTTGTNYYLFDEEPPPPPGVTYPGAQWSLSGNVALGSTATQTFLPVNFATNCSGCALKIAVGAATRQVAINISCVANAVTLCLNASRFKVRVNWATSDGRSGAGQAISLTGDTGYFWFFTPNNIEMVVKVVDGRVVNSRFWVFAGGLTDVNVVMTVADTQTGAVKSYTNLQGTAFQPIQDTGTFLASNTPEVESRSPSPKSGEEGLEDEVQTSADRPESGMLSSGPAPASTAAACTPNATTLCLKDSRFKVQVQWTAGDGSTGSGQAVSLTGDTGYFWFFSPNNVEMVLKAVDGCAFNSHFWVFAGGLTNVNIVTTVTDTQTGVVQRYVNPQGVAFQPLQDTSAFACP